MGPLEPGLPFPAVFPDPPGPPLFEPLFPPLFELNPNAPKPGPEPNPPPFELELFGVDWSLLNMLPRPGLESPKVRALKFFNATRISVGLSGHGSSDGSTIKPPEASKTGNVPKGTVFAASPLPENEARSMLTPKPPGSLEEGGCALLDGPSSPSDNPANGSAARITRARSLSHQVDRRRCPFMSVRGCL